MRREENIMADEKGPGGLTRLMHAAILKEPGALMRLLTQSAEEIDEKDKDGMTALHYAALWGFKNNVSLLLEAGANPYSKDTSEETPLDVAIRRGHVEAAVLLEKAQKAAPLIKPEDLPAHVIKLEETVKEQARVLEEMRQQIKDMIRREEVKTVSAASPQPPSPGS